MELHGIYCAWNLLRIFTNKELSFIFVIVPIFSSSYIQVGRVYNSLYDNMMHYRINFRITIFHSKMPIDMQTFAFRWSIVLCFQSTSQMPVQFKLPVCVSGELLQVAASLYPYGSWNKVRKLQVCGVNENNSFKCWKFGGSDIFINPSVFIVTDLTLSIPPAASWFNTNITHLSDSFDDAGSFL